MYDPKDLKAGTLVDSNARANAIAAQEAERYYEALRDSREAQNLQDAILAALKATTVNRPNDK